MVAMTPFLWFNDKADEAAKFYASVIPNSKYESATPMAADSPSGPPGSVKVVSFTLAGWPMIAMSAAGADTFNHSVSLMLECDTQEEVDRLWDALKEGGRTEACGWLKDRYGLSWQIVPKRLSELMQDKDRAKAKRVAEAMMQMVKIDVAELERAAKG